MGAKRDGHAVLFSTSRRLFFLSFEKIIRDAPVHGMSS